MASVLLGDYFSVTEQGYIGRPIANRTLVQSIFGCPEIDKVLAPGDPQSYRLVVGDETANAKLVSIVSPVRLVSMIHEYRVVAIFCSTTGKKYAQFIHFRNLNKLNCRVYGFTHSLSYQDEVGSIYRLLCANPSSDDAILCTSKTAISVMSNLISKVQCTLSFRPLGPDLRLFPLSYEAEDLPTNFSKSGDYFQVLFVGRLDWRLKADLMVLPHVISELPAGHRIRFVIAGSSANREYIRMLQEACCGMPVIFELDVSDKRKNELFRESHAFFSPSDNYQETFGVSILEAKHHGCVPVISDFDGYRYLVKDGQDGCLLKTYGARVPERLWGIQALMPDPVYHAWWAAGVSIDPAEAARVFMYLSTDPENWQLMSTRSIESAYNYSYSRTVKRFGELLGAPGSEVKRIYSDGETGKSGYPFQIDYSEIFSSHPSCYWSEEKILLTNAGLRFMQSPAIEKAPQLRLLMDTVTLQDIVTFLQLVERNKTAADCMGYGVKPITLSVALKSGLISVNNQNYR